MFVIVPTGHTRSVWGTSWLTYGLIGLCTLAFVVTWRTDESADAQLRAAASRMDDLLYTHRDMGVDPAIVAPLPPTMKGLLPQRDPDDWLDQDEEEAALMDDGARHLVDAFMANSVMRFGYRPAEPSVLQAVSSMFMHGDIWHLLGNMLFLWLTGLVIELFWGRGRFLALYLLSGLAATAAHHLSAPHSYVALIGASGAISGLLGAFLVGHYKERINFWYAFWLLRFVTGTFSLRAWIALPLWFGLQLAWALLDDTGQVAYWAHVGGFAFGVVAALIADRLGWVAHPHSLAPAS